MDWITGLQHAIDFIEEHLTEPIDYNAVAQQSFSSSYHFQRVFNILCGFTVGEYIRNRRLSLAGTELAVDGAKVIDVALKYGYESPDSFAKAFQKFHGITPSAARAGGTLRSFSRLVLNISLKGGYSMNYRIEQKPAMVFTGYKRRFVGDRAERLDQEHEFHVSTRANQYILYGLAGSRDDEYSIMTNFDDDGYDYYIAGQLDEWITNHLDATLGTEDAKRFETIEVPEGLYLVCETERSNRPIRPSIALRQKVVSEWLPSSGYELTDAPEIQVTHWFYEYGNTSRNHSRYIELWLPIVKK